MPTPVNTARQCLTQEGATVLDEAVSVAKRRGHAQTTSLHMVSSLLSLPDSILREACMHARNNFNHSSRVQFKALELSLSVSLDRLPSSSKSEEPPVSNSLMAAVKRSQANQRRQPENFSFYQQQDKYSGSSSISSVPVVKVELKNLILSILDDPLVSRVLGEAGFRSCDVKMALIRPNYASSMFGAYTSRYRRSMNSPPMFLCNFGDSTKGFNFPFMGCFSSSTGDDQQSWKRISEVMVREKKRNPLLLGVGASDILTSFLEMLRRDDGKGVLPEKLGVVSVKDEVLKLMSEDSDEGLKFDQVGRTVADSDGVVVNLGDLEMLDGVSVDNLRFLVSCLSNLLQVHRGKLWLIGAVTTYDAYFKVLGKVSTIEEDWDLETVPITSLRFSVGGSFPRSNLMESFVPLGGFFSMPSEIKIPLINTSRCHLCNEKCEQEIASVTKRGISSSAAERYHSTLPRWLTTKGKDDNNNRLLLNAKITDLEKKWDNICWGHHYNQTLFPPRLDYQFPRVTGFRLSKDREEINSNDCKSNKQGDDNVTDIRKSSGPTSLDMLPKDENPTTTPSSATTYLAGSDPKLLYQALVDKIGDLHRQAISALAQAITRCQSMHGVARNGLWINLKGPDLIFKIKLGLGLAETFLHGNTESFVCVDLDLKDEKPFADTLFNNLRVKNKYDATMRLTVIEYLVEILSKKPCIVFLENIDKADLMVQNSLSLAMETGKLTDSRGREANIGNSVFLGSARYTEEEEDHNLRSSEDLKSYSEEDVLTAKGSSIKILIGYDLNDASDVLSRPSGKGFFDANHLNKRKLMGGRSRITNNKSLELVKRANKSSLDSYLDLNLPAEEENEVHVPALSSENSPPTSTALWFERRIDQVVVLEPIDFDALAEKLYEEACKCLRDVLGYKCSMEIERKVMQQFLAAAFLYGYKEVENWIQNILRHGFVEAMGKFGIDTRSTVKLATCDEPYQGLLLLLPPTIIF